MPPREEPNIARLPPDEDESTARETDASLDATAAKAVPFDNLSDSMDSIVRVCIKTSSSLVFIRNKTLCKELYPCS